jgi:hypothetical protein
MTPTIYALGIPTKPDFITDELSNFINDGVPTLYITMNNRSEKFDGYNFFEQNNFEFVQRYNANTTAEIIQNSEKRLLCAFPVNPFDYFTSSPDGAVIALPKRIGKRINRILDEIRLELPTIRIAFCTYGSPWLKNRSVLAALNDSQCPFIWNVIDVRSFDDPDSDKFYKAGFVIYGVLPKDSHRRLPIDRSGGIFFSSDIPDDLRIPTDTHTDLTYAQVVDEAALSYAGQSPIVAWSGGIDSTVIVAAFIKNNINFKVTVGNSTLKENPEMHAYLIANYKTIALPDDNDFSNIADTSVIVTGEPNGHLFPRLKPNFMLDSSQHFNYVITSAENIDPSKYADTLLIDVPDEYLYNNVRQSFIRGYQKTYKSTEAEASTFYDEYLKPKLDKFPFEVKHYYQLIFFFKLIFGYQEVLIEPFIKGSKCKNTARPFFHTPNFQRWAITNMDFNFENYCTNYQTEKQICKQYIYDVLNIPSQLQLHKYPSQISRTQNL